MVTKNKTSFRPNLQLDETLSSLLTVKLANPQPCYNYEPPEDVVEMAKKLQWCIIKHTAAVTVGMAVVAAVFNSFNLCLPIIAVLYTLK